jgi:hypothetical protein
MMTEQDLPQSNDSSEADELRGIEAYTYPYYYSLRAQNKNYEPGVSDEFERTVRDTEFIVDRIDGLAKEATQKGKMSPQEAFQWVANDYFSIAKGTGKYEQWRKVEYDFHEEAIHHQIGMLEVLHQRDAAAGISLEGEPKATVFIPVAILHEKEQSVEHTLNLIAQQSIANDIEVVLWANYKREAGATVEEASAKLDRILQSAKAQSGDIKVRSMLASYDAQDDNLTMSKLRKDAMDVLLMDGMERSFKFDHPVVWFDADVQSMSPNTVELLANSIDASVQEVHPMARANLVFANDPDQPEQPENIAKVAAVHELIRRKAERMLKDMTDEEKKKILGNAGLGTRAIELDYPEENGFSIGMGMYALLAGISAWNPTGETLSLKVISQAKKDSIKDVIKSIYPEVKQFVAAPERVAGAKIRASNRRKLANLHNLAVEFNQYPEYIDRKFHPSRISPVITYRDFAHAGEESLSKANGTDLDEAVITKLVEAYYNPETWNNVGSSPEESSDALQELRRYIPKVLERAGIAKPNKGAEQ